MDGQCKRRLCNKKYDSSRSYSTSQEQDKLEKHCSKDGLLEREDIVLFAGALSQVKKYIKNIGRQKTSKPDIWRSLCDRCACFDGLTTIFFGRPRGRPVPTRATAPGFFTGMLPALSVRNIQPYSLHTAKSYRY